MKKRVLYFLGAGFSAPLGLPVMSNFISKSTDQYLTDPEQYKYVKRVIDHIARLSRAKNYFEADMHNIEEVMSILDIEEKCGKEGFTKDFKDYLIGVIRHYTPEIKTHFVNNNQWYRSLVSENTTANRYADFVLSLFNVAYLFYSNNRIDGHAVPSNNKQDYSVITMNYDIVLESLAAASFPHLNLQFKSDPLPDPMDWSSGPYLAHLHGSIETGVIIPPTSSKSHDPEIREAWKLGYQLLSTADEIRFIGYSLPVTDAYVRYLLKSAIVGNIYLKKIDVICYDPTGAVERNYSSFISFPGFRFSGRMFNVLNRELHDVINTPQGNGKTIRYQFLEDFHEEHFSGRV